MRRAKDIIEDLNAVADYFKEETGGSVPVCLEEAVEFIQQEQRPEAKWERITDSVLGQEFWRCTRCGIRQPIQMDIEFARWCPFCRSSMKGKKEEEE